MKSLFFRFAVALGLCCCFALSSVDVSVAAEAKPAKPVAKKVQKAQKVEKAAPKTEAEIRTELGEFAHKAMASMNKVSLPSKTKKNIVKNADGSFTATYREVDLNSIKYEVIKPKKEGPVDYVGDLRYVEITYMNTAPTKEAADKGEFKVQSKESLRELVRYMKGKWDF
jgi:hypothetical protein